MLNPDTYGIFTKGALLLYPQVEGSGLPLVIQRVLKKTKERGYQPLGKELETSTHLEIEELIFALMSKDESVVIRTAYACAVAEGNGEITSMEEAAQIIIRILTLMYLYRRIRPTGWEPDFGNFSVFEENRKIFKNITLKDLGGNDIEKINSVIDKELY